MGILKTKKKRSTRRGRSGTKSFVWLNSESNEKISNFFEKLSILSILTNFGKGVALGVSSQALQAAQKLCLRAW